MTHRRVRTPTTRPAARQRGAAALIVTILIVGTMVLIAMAAHRGTLFEQHAAANQVRAAQAFEAAESGLAWALAQLSRSQAIDERCLPSDDPAAGSFRSRYLDDADSGRLLVRSWRATSDERALQASCVRVEGAWSCSCPADGPSLPADADSDVARAMPAFTIRFAASDQPGLVRLIATGCVGAVAPCIDESPRTADASARLEIVAGHVPGLASAPRAALTAVGDVTVGPASLGLHNPDAAAGGLTLEAGGGLDATALRLTTAPGGSLGDSLSTGNATLAAIDAARLFTTHFGLDKATWRAHPAVHRLRCADDCGAALVERIEASAENRMLFIDGDARIEGPVTLGSADRPIALVIDGRAQLVGEVVLHGVLYAGAIRWDDATTGRARVLGAVISESDYQGNGAADLHRDAAALRLLQLRTGSFARVPGSWRDF